MANPPDGRAVAATALGWEQGSVGQTARPSSEQSPDLPRIPGYRLERTLGAGGMGMVFLAVHETLLRPVALKVMRAELARDQTYAARFLREARAAARVSHHAVVQIHDAGDAGGHLYLAMEYLPGGDLRKALAGGPLPEAEALAAIAAAAEGMAAIHRAGLVHRDLKPENLLRDAQSAVKVGDLGLARPSAEAGAGADGVPHLTAQGDALGTPAYMAPEQAQGAADLDARCDVYGLAATLYTLLTARPPFSGPTSWAVVHQVISAPPPDPRAQNPGVSAATAALVVRALAKERAARPATMDDFAAEIAACRAALGDQRSTPTVRQAALPVPPAATPPTRPAAGANGGAGTPATAPIPAKDAPGRRSGGVAAVLAEGIFGGLRILARLLWLLLRVLWWMVATIIGTILRLLVRVWLALSLPWRVAGLVVALAACWLLGLLIYTRFQHPTESESVASAAENLGEQARGAGERVADDAGSAAHQASAGADDQTGHDTDDQAQIRRPSPAAHGGEQYDHPWTPSPANDAANSARPGPDPDQNPFHALRDAIRGSLVKDIAGEVPELDAQVRRACADRGWEVRKHHHDEDDGSAEISARMDDGATITVDLDPLPGGKVRVRLRVGVFGDQDRQKQLFPELFP
jgi:hypothetical protein